MKKYAVLVGFIVVASLLGWAVWKSMDDPSFVRTIPSPLIGKPAPAFDVPSLLDESQRVSNEQFKGKAWLLNVWGSWCPECWREQPYLVRLSQAEDLLLVGLNWRDEKADALAMLRKAGNPFDAIGYDFNSEVAIDWGVYGAPETFVIDKQGIIRYKHVGGITPAVWAGELGQKYRYYAAEN